VERRCNQCAHFRPRRNLAENLRLANSLDTAQTVSQIMDTQQRLLGQEEGLKVELLASHRERWPFKPQVQAYCGVREDQNVYLVHEIKNRDGDCDDFAPDHEQARRPCETCVHRRAAAGRDRDARVPMDVISPANSYMDTNKSNTSTIDTVTPVSRSHANEEMLLALHTGGTLPQPPSYYAHCGKYSSPGKYVICTVKNPHGRCGGWSGYSHSPS
jgi:hypothetical protein